MNVIPYGHQSIGEEEIAAVVEVLRSDFLTQGPVVERFEEEFARVVGAPHAVACSSGTAALHLAALAAGLGPGDRVLVPAVTFVASANAGRFVGADVAFADIDGDDLTLSPAAAEAVLEKARRDGRPFRALVTVDLAGHPCDMAAFGRLADAHGLIWIADACHALGATWTGPASGQGKAGPIPTAAERGRGRPRGGSAAAASICGVGDGDGRRQGGGAAAASPLAGPEESPPDPAGRTNAGADSLTRTWRVGEWPRPDFTVFSFHPVKHITTAEGGMVTTHDPRRAARLRRLRTHGIVRDPDRFVFREEAFDRDGQVNPWYYEVQALGYNYRLTDLQSALGLVQLRRLPEFLARRRTIVDRYRRELAGQPGVRFPAVRSGCVPAWHLAIVRIDYAGLGTTRGQVMRRLRERGVGTQVHYLPLPMMPFYAGSALMTNLPRSLGYYREALSLPLFPGMSDADVTRVLEALHEVLG